MFVDALLAHLLIFAVGQTFALLFLRRGRAWIGLAATLGLWGSLDWWLVARYVLAKPQDVQQWPVLGLYVTAGLTIVAFLWWSLCKRIAAPKRPQRYRDGLTHLLSGDLESAAAVFGQLAWSDPGDSAAWIGRGDACRRLGHKRRARRYYRRARAVDVDRSFTDILAHRLVLLQRNDGAPVREITAKGPQLPMNKARRTSGKVASGA